MRGLWLEDGRVTYREDLEDPVPDPQATQAECRVEVLRAGVCATDLALLRGTMGFRGIPGHEFVGRALDGPLAGQRVGGEINAACGSCSGCLAGEERHCPQRTVLGSCVACLDLAGRHPERAELLASEPRWCESPEDRAYDLVVEATGDPEVLTRALGWVRPRGTVVLSTTAERPANLDLAPLVVDEITLVGSRCGPFEPALAALADGSVRVEPMIDARFPLSRGSEALARAGERGVLKVLLTV